MNALIETLPKKSRKESQSILGYYAEKARAEGERIGEQKGKQEGKREGKQETMEELISNFITNCPEFTDEAIAKTLSLPIETVQAVRLKMTKKKRK